MSTPNTNDIDPSTLQPISPYSSRKIAELRQVIATLADAATAQRNDGLDRLEWIRKTAFDALDMPNTGINCDERLIASPVFKKNKALVIASPDLLAFAERVESAKFFGLTHSQLATLMQDIREEATALIAKAKGVK